MTAASGTIPALTQYGTGAQAIASTVTVEIVDTQNATTAASYCMYLLDFVGKAPSVMSDQTPTSADMFAFYRPSTGLFYSALVGNINVPAGNMPAAGNTSQILAKNSATDNDVSWISISTLVSVSTATLTSSGSTAVIIGITAFGVGSAQIATNAVLNANLTAAAVDSTKLAAGSIYSTHLTANSIFSSVIATGAIGSTQIGNFAVQTVNIATSAVVGTSIVGGAINSSHMAVNSIFTTAIATNVVNYARIQQGTGLSVLGVAGTAVANYAAITGATAQILGVAPGGTTVLFTGAPNIATSLVVGTTAVTAYTGVIVANTFLQSIGGFKRTSAAYSTATTTLADIANLSATLQTGGTYIFDAKLFVTAGSTGGSKIAVGYSATATHAIFEMVGFDTTLLTQIYTTSLNAALAVSTAATTPCISIRGSIVASTGGNLSIQIAQQASTTTATQVATGSLLQVLQVA